MIYMIGYILVAVAVVTIITAIVNNRKKHKTKISFRESIDLVDVPVVTFYIKGRRCNLLLDTGSDLSYIDINYLNYNHIGNPAGKTVKSIGVEGTDRTSELHKLEITYRDNVFVEDFYASDFSAAFGKVKSQTGVTIHGILGSNFLSAYKYIIDFKEFVAYSKK